MEEKRQIRATAIGLDNVISAWETMNNGYPYFAVFYNRSNKYFQYNGDNLEAAKEYLQNNLSAIEQAGDNALYYLNIYPEHKVNYTPGGHICSFPFRLNEFEPSGSVGGVSSANMDAFARMLKESQEKNLELTREILELKTANEPLDWFDRIGGILEHPQAAGVVVPLLQPVISGLMGLIGKISGLPVAPVGMAAPAANPVIAGPDEKDVTDLIDAALDRLEKHGDLVDMLTRLANFADNNPEQFKMYFKMLPK